MNANNEPCARMCEYAMDVGMEMYASTVNGKCAEHDGYMRHLSEMDARAAELADGREEIA